MKIFRGPLGVLAVAAAALIAAGTAVLSSGGARDVGADWYTMSVAHRGLLEGLQGWNGTKTAGAALVILGLIGFALLVGALLGARLGRLLARRGLLWSGAAGAAIAVAGAVAWAYPRAEEVSYGGTYQLLRGAGGQVQPPPTATWALSTGQVAAAGAMVAGVLVLVASASALRARHSSLALAAH